jgi:hypothetical protein
VLFWASTLHVAAMVMIGLKVLDHLRYTLVRWPLMVAAFTGWLRGPEAARMAAPGPATSPAVGAGAGGDE